jgi:hypothetical protein
VRYAAVGWRRRGRCEGDPGRTRQAWRPPSAVAGGEGAPPTPSRQPPPPRGLPWLMTPSSDPPLRDDAVPFTREDGCALELSSAGGADASGSRGWRRGGVWGASGGDVYCILPPSKPNPFRENDVVAASALANRALLSSSSPPCDATSSALLSARAAFRRARSPKQATEPRASSPTPSLIMAAVATNQLASRTAVCGAKVGGKGGAGKARAAARAPLRCVADDTAAAPVATSGTPLRKTSILVIGATGTLGRVRQILLTTLRVSTHGYRYCSSGGHRPSQAVTSRGCSLRGMS